MDDKSFDPRSWGKTPPEKPDKGKTDPAPPPIPPGGSPGESQLPEAWRGIGTQFSPGGPLKDAARSRGRQIYHPAYGSAALLFVAAVAAWQTRVPAVPVAGHSASAPAAQAVPGSTERSLRLGSPGEIAGALKTLGLSDADSQAAALAAATDLKKQDEIRMKAMMIQSGKGYVLDRLQVSYLDGSGTVVSRAANGTFAAAPVVAELTNSIKFTPGEIDDESFYTSAVSAGVPDTLVPEFINAFAYDFNLAAEVTPGDTFEVAYQQSVNASGDPVGTPELVYAKLTTAEKSLALYRFKTPDGTVGWYDGNGATTKRGLMRTPVDGARITSKFGMRFHPVLHYTRLHAGVDFAVPVGTPVYAAAAGVVIGATPTGCGGNMAVVQHDNGWVTRYFHLSRYADGLHEGQRVPQGFTLGLSGTTGTCTTGPHLHFELRIDGEPVDPLSVPTEGGKRESLEGAVLAAFNAQRNRVDVARAKQGI